MVESRIHSIQKIEQALHSQHLTSLYKKRCGQTPPYPHPPLLRKGHQLVSITISHKQSTNSRNQCPTLDLSLVSGSGAVMLQLPKGGYPFKFLPEATPPYPQPPNSEMGPPARGCTLFCLNDHLIGIPSENE